MQLLALQLASYKLCQKAWPSTTVAENILYSEKTLTAEKISLSNTSEKPLPEEEASISAYASPQKPVKAIEK